MPDDVSLTAGLDYTSTGTWEAERVYTQENLTAADEAWLALNIDYAFVALPTDQAREMDLPASLRFPWDHNKDMYLLSSVHSVHCLQVLHRSNLEYRTNHTQTYTTEHLLHCLENIRLDLTCNADDTPRFVPRTAHESTVKTGVDQLRQCRSWDALEKWAKEHSACFNYHEFERKELEENVVYPAAWSFCGEGSEYLAQVQRFYGKGVDWVLKDGGTPDIDAIKAGKGKSPIPVHRAGGGGHQ
ncbi:uncharacterized protein AB675_7161 [Cyphellophora attinorum]|uniref:Uncharacterized protein n=1 Tax=Cyphellophora attinorum TaxID=1664694 RepID=A0A0N1P322_9EURO|nr:uncharacterized protein AB675_7161 [Phialophora attinorum]KPI43357.1 hypothetical protein AB675_7161 [Phialophora attinorum]